jgi:hypothetical protein
VDQSNLNKLVVPAVTVILSAGPFITSLPDADSIDIVNELMRAELEAGGVGIDVVVVRATTFIPISLIEPTGQ